jgi:hypothetical protein
MSARLPVVRRFHEQHCGEDDPNLRSPRQLETERVARPVPHHERASPPDRPPDSLVAVNTTVTFILSS